MAERNPRIGILVVAYNAASTLAAVLDRIPDSFRPRIDEVFVCDDCSQDSTYLVGLGYKQLSDLPLTVIRHPKNLGYGGNQKAGYQLAIEHDLDVIVMLHGDGQYAPECIETLVEPILSGDADAVFGSRMLVRGDARKGGMPLYKFAGNRILTTFQNRVLGTNLSEFHSGYRAYSVKALASVPFHRNSDGFNFDTQIILQFLDAGHGIVEVPIPTYYGDEICYVNGMRYAMDVTANVLAYRLGKMGIGQGGAVGAEYQLKESENSSHGILTSWLESYAPSRVLDLGCSGGRLAERLRAQGHTVTGIEMESIPGAAIRLDRLIVANLEDGIPAAAGDGYDIVIAGDVLEHVSTPEKLLGEIRQVLRPGGSAVVSVPNFGHWYPRIRVILGLFDYDARGILDRGHLRFFTRRSFRRIARRSGWGIARTEYVGLPLDVLADGNLQTKLGLVRTLDRFLVGLRPTLFAYQFVFELRPLKGEPGEEIHLGKTSGRPLSAATG